MVIRGGQAACALVIHAGTHVLLTNGAQSAAAYGLVSDSRQILQHMVSFFFEGDWAVKLPPLPLVSGPGPHICEGKPLLIKADSFRYGRSYCLLYRNCTANEFQPASAFQKHRMG